MNGNLDETRLPFACDYMAGAHPQVLARLVETNLASSAGYGLDAFSRQAKEKLRAACQCPAAEIHFLVGGTQTNAAVIDGLLASYQGVLAADSGHVSVHEAGAIEFGGHKVLTLPQKDGKLSARQIAQAVEAYRQDANRDHMVMPGMVYLSHPTEYGTLYSLDELTAVSAVCRENGLPLYLDGARLAYALACPENDLTLPDIARLCDVFYIGGTKCGALFGEAVVIPRPGLLPHFFTVIKQHGALLAKGRLLGVQFDALFTDGLYQRIGADAVRYAQEIRQALRKRGFSAPVDSPTNQVFCEMSNAQMQALERQVALGFWESRGADRSVVRFTTSWATRREEVDALLTLLPRADNT